MRKTMMLSNFTIADSTNDSFVGDIYVEDGKIIEVAASLDRLADVHLQDEGRKWFVVPGFIDIHIHGATGFDTMDATQQALDGLASALPCEGTTSFLATTMTQSDSAISKALVNTSLFQAQDNQAEMLGVHLEGPFISPDRAGAQPIEYIRKPSISLFEQWQKQSGNRIKLVTIAPETEGGLAFIEELSKSGVLVSIGHSDATAETVSKAVEAGARHVTHLYNQMSPFHHREPGLVGACLLEDDLSVELIADFIHSHPKALELAFRQKKAQRVILITDAMRAKGLQPGIYDLGGQDVHVNHNEARLGDGTLAGSVLTMENATKNMKSATGCTISELVAMTSTNAAKKLGLSNKGRIEAGKDADFTIIDENWNVQMTICRGNIAYTKEDIVWK
jgi:N-acetylglucosamine-6-phosphate deacetylase